MVGDSTRFPIGVFVSIGHVATDMFDVIVASIKEAARALQGGAYHTSVPNSFQLDALSDARIFLNCKNFQRVGAFKFREAYHAVARPMSSQPSRIFATVTSGNHGPGIAGVARLLQRATPACRDIHTV